TSRGTAAGGPRPAAARVPGKRSRPPSRGGEASAPVPDQDAAPFAPRISPPAAHRAVRPALAVPRVAHAPVAVPRVVGAAGHPGGFGKHLLISLRPPVGLLIDVGL